MGSLWNARFGIRDSVVWGNPTFGPFWMTLLDEDGPALLASKVARVAARLILKRRWYRARRYT